MTFQIATQLQPYRNSCLANKRVTVKSKQHYLRVFKLTFDEMKSQKQISIKQVNTHTLSLTTDRRSSALQRRNPFSNYEKSKTVDACICNGADVGC